MSFTRIRVRVFFAAWPEPPWCRALVAAVRAASVDDAEGAEGRELPLHDLHVTLRFLGAVGLQQLATVREAAAQASWRPFMLRFTRVEWWREAQVLAAVAPEIPEAAAELVQELRAVERHAQITGDPKAFRPHVTLARGVRAAPKALPALALELPVTNFCLALSDTRAEGARYTVLERWPATRAS